MLAKKHEFENNTILAVCDKEHIGKTYTEGEIEFKVSERFYKGDEITEEDLEKLLNESNSANLFGNKCISIAEKKGLITEKSILKIKGIKHAQIYHI